MQVQNISNNNYNTNFGATYLVRGGAQESAVFLNKAKKHLIYNIPHRFLTLGWSLKPGTMLICTDVSSIRAVNAFLNRNAGNQNNPYSPWSLFRKLSVSEKLSKIFGDDAKNIQQYEIGDILKSNFDFVKGVFK